MSKLDHVPEPELAELVYEPRKEDAEVQEEDGMDEALEYMRWVVLLNMIYHFVCFGYSVMHFFLIFHFRFCYDLDI
jgi:hypothetical protein